MKRFVIAFGDKDMRTRVLTFKRQTFAMCTQLALLLLLICPLAACGNLSTPTTSTGSSATITQSSSSTSAQAATGSFQEFALPQTNSGLMRPAIDAQGRVWFGEMNQNLLGSFNPRTGKFWQQTPPGGKWGIMGTVAAPDGTIWFAEQYADYIGHYFPKTGQYKTYPLPTLHMPDPGSIGKTLSLPSAPNDLALDKYGILWFTEMNADAIGSLNTANGSIRQYPIPGAKKGQALNPYGITVDPQGTIWFTEASTDHLGKLNPATGQFTFFTPPDVTSTLMEVASDAQGQIWETLFATGQLLRFDPKSASFTTYNAPAFDGNPGGLYGITVATNGDIWVTVPSENILARFNVKEQRFFYYTIPTPNSQPIGLVEGPHQSIWFTESASNKIGMLQP